MAAHLPYESRIDRVSIPRSWVLGLRSRVILALPLLREFHIERSFLLCQQSLVRLRVPKGVFIRQISRAGASR